MRTDTCSTSQRIQKNTCSLRRITALQKVFGWIRITRHFNQSSQSIVIPSKQLQIFTALPEGIFNMIAFQLQSVMPCLCKATPITSGVKQIKVLENPKLSWLCFWAEVLCLKIIAVQASRTAQLRIKWVDSGCRKEPRFFLPCLPLAAAVPDKWQEENWECCVWLQSKLSLHGS